MTTYIEPLDELLQDYAESVRQVILNEFAGEVGSDYFGEFGVYINRTAVQFKGMAFKRLGDKLRTPEFERLVQDLREFTVDAAWPVSFDLAFSGEAAQPRLVSLRLAQAPLAKDFLEQGGARTPAGREMHGHEIRGLHKLSEAADLIADLGLVDTAPMMEWSVVNNNVDVYVNWTGIHARSAEEAMFKLLLSWHGYEAIRTACETNDFATLLGSDDIDLVAQPVHGLEHNPCGITDDANATLAKMASQAAAARQRRAPRPGGLKGNP